jgi:conjugal transfer ATP-binding protein TraC
MTRSVLAKFRELNGAEALAEGIAGFKLFKTLLPAGNTTSVRAKRVKTDNLADFMPIYQQWEGRGKPVCVFRSRQGSLVSYDPFDPTIPNYNALVTGSAGAGKSFLNNCILLQYLSQNPLTYVIDIGGSYRKLCSFVDGVYITTEIPKNGESFRGINPFQLSAVETEPSPRKIKFLLSLMELILTDDEGEKLPKLEKALLEEAILTTYHICGKAGKTPRMTDLKVYMERSENARLLNFSKMLYPWTGDRPFGRMLDVEQGLDLKAEFVAFDLKGLSSYPDLQSVMLLIVTDFILGKIDEHPHKKKRIIMDECWELLKRKASSSFMEYCVRTLRKTGSGITFITQGLEEIQASDIGAAILNNTATKLILLQRGDLGPVKSILHLNEREMGLIRSLGQQKGVYSEAFLIADEDRGIIQVVPTPAEYWLATSDAADNRWINEVQTRFPDKRLSEVIHWLAEQFPQGSQGRPKIPEQILDKAFEGGKS